MPRGNKCVSIWYNKYCMIVQSVSTVVDMVNHRDRTTFYKTVEDPETNRTTLEVVSFLYDRKGQITPNDKGLYIDSLA